MSGSTTINPNVIFNEIPSPLYKPGSYMEVRPTFGNIGILPIPARNLIIAQMITTGGGAGTATPLAIQQNIIEPQQATLLFGAGSMAEGAVIAYLAGGSGLPLDVIGIADGGGAAKAVFTVTFGGTWTLNGTTAIQIAGVRFAYGTLSTDTPASTATEIQALIAADPQCPYVATVATDVITLTAKNAGLEANNLAIVVSPANGDALVPGMTCTIAQSTQGATNPSISAAISAITGLWYTGICAPFQDATNIGLLTAELARRFNAMVREDSRAWHCVTGTYSQGLAAIPTINSQFVAPMPMTAPGSMPWQVAASMMGVGETSLIQDPSLQLGDLALPGIIGPQRANLLNDTEQELMLAGKGSTFNVLRDGTVTFQRVVSSYTQNSQGVPDSTTWFDINETAVASRIRYDWRNYFKLLFPRNKLAPDGSLAAEYNPNVCTPSRATGAWASRMLTYAKQGWIVNETADIRAAYFTIDANDPNRLNYQVQYTRIGNLIVDAGVLQFVAS